MTKKTPIPASSATSRGMLQGPDEGARQRNAGVRSCLAFVVGSYFPLSNHRGLLLFWNRVTVWGGTDDRSIEEVGEHSEGADSEIVLSAEPFGHLTRLCIFRVYFSNLLQLLHDDDEEFAQYGSIKHL